MFQSIRHTFKLLRIFYTLARYDALVGIESLRLPAWLVMLQWLLRRRRDHMRPGQRLAKAMETLGPSFVKLGQSLATRPDLIGETIAADLAGLQDKLPPFPSEKAVAIIEEDLGAPLDTLFANFDRTPIAAASIAQVHFATLHTGEAVAVKVLRPDVEKAFANDFKLFFWLAHEAEKRLSNAARLKPLEVVKTLRQTVQFELDLRFEAAAATELRANMAQEDFFHVPQIFWPHTSGRVLTLERIDGVALSDIDAVYASGADRTKLVEYAAIAFFQQVFRDGFFHADLHPGNLFLRPNGMLAAVDFGIMGRLDLPTRLFLAETLWSFLQEDYHRVAQVHVDCGYVPADTNVEHFASACMAIGKPILGKEMQEISIARLLGQLFQIAETFRMEVQPHLLLLQKNMMVAEGVGRALNPNVNMWKLAEPLIAEWGRSHLSGKARIARKLREAAQSIQRLPQLVERLEEQLQREETKSELAIATAEASPARFWRVLPWLLCVGLATALAWQYFE